MPSFIEPSNYFLHLCIDVIQFIFSKISGLMAGHLLPFAIILSGFSSLLINSINDIVINNNVQSNGERLDLEVAVPMFDNRPTYGRHVLSHGERKVEFCVPGQLDIKLEGI